MEGSLPSLTWLTDSSEMENIFPADGAFEEDFPVNENQAFDKPPYSFPCLIGLALYSSDSNRLSVSQIYDFITAKFPFFLTAKPGWKNSVRHNLSLNKFFCKLDRVEGDGGKGTMWGIASGMQESLRHVIELCENKGQKNNSNKPKNNTQTKATPTNSPAKLKKKPHQATITGNVCYAVKHRSFTNGH